MIRVRKNTWVHGAIGGEEVSQVREGGAKSMREARKLRKGERNETVRSIENFQTLSKTMVGKASDKNLKTVDERPRVRSRWSMVRFHLRDYSCIVPHPPL